MFIYVKENKTKKKNVNNVHTRIGIPKARNTDDFLGSGTKLLFTFLSLRFSDMRRRETQFFTMLTVRTLSALNSLTQTKRASRRPNKSRIGDLGKSTRPI